MTHTLNQPEPAVTVLGDRLLAAMLEEHQAVRLPRLRRLWDYYRNPALGQGDRASTAQVRGLPARLIQPADRPREIVIENDIAWRLHAQIDFMFGRELAIASTAADPDRAQQIESLLRRVLDGAGGDGFLHDMALLGHVYGSVDVLVRPGGSGALPGIDLIDPPSAAPLLNPHDYRRLDAYVVHQSLQLHRVEAQPLLRRLWAGEVAPRRATARETRVWTHDRVSVIRGPVDRPTSVEHSDNVLGRVPVVHIQNLPQPFHYEGLSEVEPLIPLQDELNTRLCDRANRVTFQSFKMYLGRGLDGFVDRPVGPGQMWQTDNIHASIQEFGGDRDCPGEESHILEVREAMDKCSGVSPVSAGVVRDRVGNLTSENALRIVLMGLVAKTRRKRITYGAGIAQLCELILHAADVAGTFPNAPEERGVRIQWPDPLPQ
jgi:hypothetical protein